MKIKIIIPTAVEARYFEGDVVIGGVGVVEMARSVMAVLAQNPDVVILAGIAGAYGNGLEIGQTVVVESERTADCGAFRGEKFEVLFAKEYICPYARDQKIFKTVASNSVNVAGAAFVEAAEIENMEGAAFFALCAEAGVKFFELRTISNRVGDLPAEWNIPLATKNLAHDLKKFIEAL